MKNITHYTKAIAIGLVGMTGLIGLSACGEKQSHDHAAHIEAKLVNGTAFENGIVVYDPKIRAVATNAKTSAGYMIMENTSDQAITLNSMSADLAQHTEIHETMMMDDGTNMMRRLRSVVINPGAQVAFESSGKHIMFIGLFEPFDVDKNVRVTFVFDGGETKGVLDMPIVDLQTDGHAHHNHH